MNGIIILIIGLPGSGKTYLANQININNEYTVIDDIKSISQLPNDGNIIITDVNFCDDRILQLAKNKLNSLYPNHTIECIYFENNKESAIANVLYRNDGRYVDNTICRFAKIYNPPQNAITIKKQ